MSANTKFIAKASEYLRNHFTLDELPNNDNVIKGGPKNVMDYPNHTLFLCWPPLGESMAYECLQNFSGKHVIYIGEGAGGCTADNQFHDLLETKFEHVTEYVIPQYSFIHDALTIWKRK